MTGAQSSPRRQDVFVGRERELGDLMAALDATLGGHGQIVTISGEPGMGKTRLCEELAASARARGLVVVWGRCREQAGAPPYWPWTQAFRAILRELSDQISPIDVGSDAAVLTQLLPEMGGAQPGTSQVSDVHNPEGERFRLFSAMVQLLRAATIKAPILVILENLHWADVSSLRFLEYCAPDIAESRLTLIGTFREADASHGDHLGATMGAINRERHFSRIVLPALSIADTAALLRQQLGLEPAESLIRSVYDTAEGSPFYTRELARLILDERASAHATPAPGRDIRLAVPPAAREVMTQRIGRLPHLTQETLKVASVAGREFEVETVARAMSVSSVAQVMAHLDPAVEAALVNADDSPGRFRFSHALVRQALYGTIPPGRRASLHAAIATAIEAAHFDDIEAFTEQLAFHFSQAEPITGPEPVARYTLMAAGRALRLRGFDEAAAFYRQALEAHGDRGDLETARILDGLGRASTASFRAIGLTGLDETFDALWRAFDLYRDAGCTREALNVAGYPLPNFRPALADKLATALELATPDSAEAGLLLSRFAQAVGIGLMDYDRSIEAFDRAQSVAFKCRDPDLELWTAGRKAHVQVLHMRWVEGLESVGRVLAHAPRSSDLEATVHAAHWASEAARTVGDGNRASAYDAIAMRAAESSRIPFRIAQAHAQTACTGALLGDWPAARLLTEAGRRYVPAFLVDLRQAFIDFQLGNIDRADESFDRARKFLTDNPDGQVRYPFVALSLATMAHVADRTDIAALARLPLERILTDPGHVRLSTFGRTPAPLVGVLSALALVMLAQRDAEAVTFYSDLQVTRGTVVPLLAFQVAADRLLGRLAQAGDRPEQAAQHFEDALQFCRKAGYGPELARTCHDYAVLLLTRPDGRRASVPIQSDGGSTVGTLLAEGLKVATDLGMKPLVVRLENVKAGLEKTSLPPSRSDRLTERELEVLRLVARGKSNREIAEALVISENTVIRHVSNILAKTGTANRTEAAAYAARSGISGEADKR